jgi:hypothetical protein
MATTVKLWSYHGSGSGTTTDISGGEFRHKRADNDTADLNSPIPIPPDGDIEYGWLKHSKVSWQTPPATRIFNLRWYLDPVPAGVDPAQDWVGVTMWIGITATYAQATATDENSLRAYVNNNAENYPSSSPFVINGTTVLSSGQTGVGTQSFLCYQLAITAEATGGVIYPRTSWYRWEES